MKAKKPEFVTVANEWLVRAQGHARSPHEQSLAEELRRAYDLGVAHAIEALHASSVELETLNGVDPALVAELIERIRDATAEAAGP